MKLICHSYMFKNCFIISFILFFVSTFVHAVEVKDLYQAKVAVSSQTSSQRNKALKKAMQAVMVKVGGQVDVIKNEVIKKAILNYNLYVSQYTYQRDEQLMLLASFNEDKINELLTQAQLPLWGSLRPQILLWLVEENKLSRQILSESSLSPYPFIVQNYSHARGLPVIMPLMDLTDSDQINITDVWGRFISPLSRASQRYGAEAIVIIRISNSSLLAQDENSEDCQPLCIQTQYGLDWTLVTGSQNQQRFSKQYQGIDSHALLQDAIDDITHIIYKKYALSTNSNHQFMIDVANVDSVVSYMEINQFLEQLSSVQSVTLVNAQGTNRRFNLQLLGSEQAFLSSLKLNKQLQQYLDPLAEVIPDSVPVFYWGKP